MQRVLSTVPGVPVRERKDPQKQEEQEKMILINTRTSFVYFYN